MLGCARGGNHRMGALNTWCFRLIASVTLMVSLTACGNTPSSEADIEFPSALSQTEGGRDALEPVLAGTITIDGSSTVFPVTTVMAKAFQKMHAGVHFTVGVSGTGGGFKKFCAGETDITGASRPINAMEVELCKTRHIDYFELPIAFDSLSVVVHVQNTMVNCLTVAELKKIWEPAAQGIVTHWNQIRASFPNQPLLLYGPGHDSGTFDYFTLAIVGAEGKSRSDYTPSEDDMVLVDGVSSHIYGLGYFGYAYYLSNRDRLKAVAIDSSYGCVSPSPQTVADSSYQPLSRPIFIYVKQSAATRPEVKAFTDFYLEPENASLVIQVGYVPLPTLTLRAALSRFSRGMTGSAFGGIGSVLGVNQTGLHQRQ
jgi:phosphate transport system substrate-binding protein